MVTCMEAIKKSSDDEMAISQLVVGTEQGDIIFLDPSGTTVLKTVNLSSIIQFTELKNRSVYHQELRPLWISQESLTLNTRFWLSQERRKDLSLEMEK